MSRQSEKITAIYCRIDYPGSSEHISFQRERALGYAKENNLPNPVLFMDNGFTGTNLDRPQFQNMVRAIKAGRVQTIVVTDIGRLVRSYPLFRNFVEQVLIPYHAVLHSVSDGLYTTKKDNYVRFVSALVLAERGRA